MALHADSFYTKGTTHKECQDYAAHQEKVVVLSDGCSSAPLVDIGARLLVRSAIINCEAWPFGRPDLFLKYTYMAAYLSASNLKLNTDCLCATLITLRATEGHFNVVLSGDGFIIAKKNDCLEIYEYKFAKGAPYYLRYGTNEWESPDDALLNYENNLPKRINNYWSKFGPTVIEKKYVISDTVEISEASMDYNEPPTFFQKIFPLSEYQWVGISSDGLGSFTELANNGTSLEQKELSVPQVITELAGFKNFQGEFVQRRCNKAFKEFSKKNWHNTDDFALAVITQ